MGLQFTKLAGLGGAAGTAATGIIVVGAFMVAYVLVLKGRLFRVLVGAVALAVLGFASILIIGYVAAHRGTRMPPPAPAFGPGGPGRPVVPGMVPPTAPNVPQPPRLDYASLVDRFGAERVARVTFSGHEGVDLGATIRARLAAWDKATKPATWSVTTQGSVAELILAPVADLQQLGAQLDMGSVTGVDDGERRLIVSVDKDRCVPKK
jgi:hypothetical protein